MTELNPPSSSSHELLQDLQQFQIVTSNDPLAHRIMAMAFNAPPINRPPLEAPFSEHAKNTKEMWKYIDDQTVREYLKRLFFIDTYGIKKEPALAIERVPDDYIDVPTDLIVSVSGFESWEGRAPRFDKSWESEYGYGHMSSLNVIKHYAGLPTELPPVSLMRMYIQPDGRIFFDNGPSDSHRIAAAMLRGDTRIRAKEVDVYKVNRDYLSEESSAVPPN